VRSPDAVTILMPCRAQRQDLFCDAVRSIVEQTSPEWRLLVIVDEDSPPALREWTAAFADPRIELLVSDGGFARALNLSMRHATTDWVAILLSDDQWDRRAVEVLRRCIAAAPDVDFFHSSRRDIDADGRPRGPIHRSAKRVTAEALRTMGVAREAHPLLAP
jgi:glycosyltransferase involved in cell wall biosynthesis